jgi:tripartite-type tricarboxylate transporter receptor subunit TctC
MNQNHHIVRRAFLGLALAFAAVGASAQAFPSKTIRLIVPFPPGGTSDTVGRLFASGLAAQLKQTVIVENRAGAGTVIGSDLVAKSAPDGHTLLLATPGLAINAAMRKGNMPYDTEADLEAVATMVDLPMVVYASPQSGLKTMADVVAAAKAKAGTISYGTAGEGSTGHLGMKLVEQATGTRLSHIPFQGSAASMNALLGGHIQLNVDTTFLGAPHVHAGKAVGIASLSAARSKLMPQVPTAIEQGVKVESAAWWMLFVRAGTPPAVTEQLNAAIRAVLQDPKTRETLEKDGFQLIGDTQAQARARFKVELANMAAAVRGSAQ